MSIESTAQLCVFVDNFVDNDIDITKSDIGEDLGSCYDERCAQFEPRWLEQ